MRTSRAPALWRSVLLLCALAPNVVHAACERITVFVQAGCPHCAAAETFLAELAALEPALIVEVHDVRADRQALARLADLSRSNGVTRPGVPAFEICGAFLLGFDRPETTGETIRALVRVGSPPRAGRTLRVPLIGVIDVEGWGLPAFTVVVGLVDGFNPCAMWVLLFLLSLLVNLRSRARVAAIAGTFVAVSGLVYFAFMAAWLNVFVLIGYSRALQLVLAAFAFLIGTVHVKDFFALHRGVTLSIPEKAKPGLYARVRGIVQARNLPAALAAAVVLAALVNVVELLCTAGLPALYTQILSGRGLSPAGYYGYLVLYNLAYVLDDALMVSVAVVTLSRRRLEAREGRWLKLLSGGVIIVFGVLLVIAPERVLG